MATVEAEIQAALTAVNARYPDAAKRDILNALSQFCDLYAGTDSYVFNDGQCEKVVTLNGTIPVTYKGSTYNIPICLYVLDSHPSNAPMCYVRPTADMMIKPSRHVDVSGKVSLPYLHEWRHPKSDILGLLQILVIIFGESCPVFAKSSSGTSVASGTADGAPMHASVHADALPNPNAATNVPSVYGFAHSTAAMALRPFVSYATAAPANSFASSSGFGPSSSYAPIHVLGSIHPEHGRANLIVALEEKLRMKLRDSIGAVHLDLQPIRKTRDDLQAGEQKIKTLLERMKEDQGHLDSTVLDLGLAVDQLDKILLEAGGANESQIDEAIDTTAPVFRQLLNSYVEDNAIEDTIYYLGEALKNDRIDLENYLKHVRSLSRQQFMLRATMQKCRRVAGLDK